MTHITIPLETAEFAMRVLEREDAERDRRSGPPSIRTMELRDHLEAIRSALAATSHHVTP